MVRLARRDHPGVRFEVGSMTGLDLPDGSVGAVLAWYSIVHVPDEVLPAVAAELHRVLRPGGVAMLGFHVGDQRNHKTEGYGGHPMRLDVYRRPVEPVAGRLRDAGFVIEAHVLLDPDAVVPGGVVLARREPGRARSQTSAVRPEEVAQLLGVQLGLLERREVPAACRLGHAHGVRGAVEPRARRPDQVVREDREPGRHLDPAGVLLERDRGSWRGTSASTSRWSP